MKRKYPIKKSQNNQITSQEVKALELFSKYFDSFNYFTFVETNNSKDLLFLREYFDVLNRLKANISPYERFSLTSNPFVNIDGSKNLHFEDDYLSTLEFLAETNSPSERLKRIYDDEIIKSL